MPCKYSKCPYSMINKVSLRIGIYTLCPSKPEDTETVKLLNNININFIYILN